MSRALSLGPSRASLFTSASAPLLDPAATAAVRRAVRDAARAGAMLLGSLAMAAAMWVMVAGPGFVSDRSSTVRAGHVRMAAR